ncbi:rab11 family-interacting protein 2 isoform X2 [Chironomus tepperi]|uniref:rab11 family-interacting protein 2 isoform X2 n=1 Tax=Chironomus tepperi TaxID=113505 RepID=UPI00391F3120
MYTPTHIQVTVQRAKGLLTKGKNGTNNCFTTIALGKEKYQTSLKDNAPSNVEWHEECELAIPSQGNRAELTLTCLHRNNFGMDEFLGQVTLPLNQMDQFERPRSRWFKLQSKPGQEKKDKDRGELEVRTSFTVKAGSLSDLSKKDKNKSSLSNITGSVGGSLLSLGAIEKRKSLKKFAKSLGTKMHVTGKKKKDKGGDDTESYTGSFSSIGTPNLGMKRGSFRNENADPGVISEDEDEFVFENLSHKSSGSSLNVRQKNNNLILNKLDSPILRESSTLPQITKPERHSDTSSLTKEKDPKVDEWEAKLYGKTLEIGHSTDSLKRRSWETSRVPLNIEQEQKEREPTIQEQSLERVSLEPEPITMTIDEKPEEVYEPKPMPRSATASEPMVTLNFIEQERRAGSANMSPVSIKSEKVEKDKENIFSKKWKNFRKEHTPSKTHSENDMIKNHLSKSSTGNGGERIIIGGENAFNNQAYVEKKIDLPKEVLMKYEGKSKEEIMKTAHNLENELLIQKQKNKELEEYLDVLLLKVMETHPKILQNPYIKQSG